MLASSHILVKYRRNLRNRIKRHWILYLLLIVPLTWVIVFHYIPMYGVIMAFQNFSIKKGYFGSQWVGTKHFERFITSPNFTMLLKNTLAISLYSMVANFCCQVVFALMLNEVTAKRYRKTVQMFSYLPYFISVVTVVAILNQVFSYYGLFNNLLNALGAERVSFFSTATSFRHMYVWSGVWSSMGYGAVIYIAALAGIPIDLYEAAELDGATRLQKIIYINIPSIMPTMTIMLLLSTGRVMSVGFEKVYMMQNNLNLSVSQVFSTYTYQIGLLNRQYSYSAAVNLFSSVVNVLLLLTTNAFARRFSETSLF